MAAAVAAAVLMAACGDGDSGGSGSGSVGAPPTFTASPIAPEHVVAISKFRSCSGHDFSPGALGHGPQGAESARSMKHYVLTDVPLAAADSVPVYAPIDGTVDIQEENFPLGKQVYINRDGWSVRIFHVDPTVQKGATVKAGQQIGSIAPANAVQLLGNKVGPDGKQPGYEFDVAITSKDNSQYLSMFEAMAPEVAKSWASRGFTASDAVISKASRDADPCALGPDGERFAQQEDNPKDWVRAS